MATAKRELSYGPVQIYGKEVLGVGSYGKVCKAKCGQLPCAAKLLHDTLFQDHDPGTRNLVKKFKQECQFVSTIKHPNIVQYLGTTSDPQSRRTVLLMELMDESLTRFLERLAGPLPYHSQLNICHDVALALAYLHSNAIIHRDLSSNNVLLIGDGRRAKVTDFGMYKLVDRNCRKMTQVPGTPAYMPPEALISPPHYSSKLDCFSHGVLALQIITRNFPDPGDATRYVADPKYPTGRALVQYPEAERRKKDIDLIEPSHPLRPIALHCLKDMDTERPSADELCGRLASLKKEPRYAHSVEQTRGHIQRLQEEIKGENDCLEENRVHLQRLQEEIDAKDRETEEERAVLQRAKTEYEHCLEEKKVQVQNLQEEIKVKDGELEEERAGLQRAKTEYEYSFEEKRVQIQRLQEEIEVKDGELEEERAGLQKTKTGYERCLEDMRVQIQKLQEENLIMVKDGELEKEKAVQKTKTEYERCLEEMRVQIQKLQEENLIMVKDGELEKEKAGLQKTETEYECCLEEMRVQIQKLQEEIKVKDGELEKEKAGLQSAKMEYEDCVIGNQMNIHELEREIQRTKAKYKHYVEELERERAEHQREEAEYERCLEEITRRYRENKREKELIL